MFQKNFLIVSIFILILLTIGIASASENLTDGVALDEHSSSETILETPINESLQNFEDMHTQINTKIESKDIATYYKENCELIGYLKDSDNNPISNKKLSVSINNRHYDKITDYQGKIVLKLSLKPGTYTASIRFDGDENYTASSQNTLVNVKKSSLTITTNDYKTYFESGFFFKAKVINKITKNPVKGVKVVFKVYNSHNKYRLYYATTDANGIAKLRKNLKVGSYKVVVQIKKDKYLKAKKSKSSLTIKQTAEMGCSSLYVQVSNTEAVGGFRRDATNAKILHIVKYKLNGKATVKQYKTNSYFFHLLTTADGWMAGTGGRDNAAINHAIEKLVGKMVKSGQIKKSYLRKIQGYERTLGIGHFSIKAPNGKYALVWASGIKTGKLKAGQYIDVPNSRSMFRQGTWEKFNKDPAKAAIKIAATDSFGVNRRDATAFHWKATTVEGKTTSTLKVYAANDNGLLAGRSTAHLKDDVIFKGTFFSKNKLPKTPSSLLLGVHNFGNIDKLIKAKTVVSAPKLTAGVNESVTFKLTVKDKKTGNPVKALILKIKIDDVLYSVKTDKNGVGQLKIKSMDAGSHDVVVYTDNIKYLVSAKSKIKITE